MSFSLAKLGGSLFDLPDLASRLTAWRQSVRGRVCVLVGGGAAVERIRALSTRLRLDDSAAHRLAIRAMSVNAHHFSAAFPGSKVIGATDHAWPALSRANQAAYEIIDPLPLLELEPDLVPEGWHVTSDSIAAALAKWFEAERLYLLKSVGDDEEFTIEDAVDRGWLDRYFPTAAEGLEVVWINLRRQPRPSDSGTVLRRRQPSSRS